LAQLKGVLPQTAPNNPSQTSKGEGTVAPASSTQTSPKQARSTTSQTQAHTPAAHASTQYTQWSFGDWPEIMEIRKGQQTLIGYPALIDMGTGVTLEVFDEPDLAAAKHRAGLSRLFALQIKDALKYLEKNIPQLQAMSVAYMSLGTQEELRDQIIAIAMERAFLMEPWPHNEAAFAQRLQEGRGRLTLIANEVARLCGAILQDWAAAQRKVKEVRNANDLQADALQQLQRLVGKRFLLDTPWVQLAHVPRYLKAVVLRIDKYRADPTRDSSRMAEFKAQEQRYWRLVAERKGVQDARMLEFRWLLEELRVSFFAQELRTPQPVSIKRLDKAWGQLNH
jgi:ATP-dependent helicase HrpA